MPGLTESSSELLLLFIFTSALLWVSYSIRKMNVRYQVQLPPSGVSILIAVLTALKGFGTIHTEVKNDLFNYLSAIGIIGGAAALWCSAIPLL